MTCLIYSNPPVPCPAGMYSLGGEFYNCTACPAGKACPNPAGAPMDCVNGKTFNVSQDLHNHVWAIIVCLSWYKSKAQNKPPMHTETHEIVG